jgi:hypothetical protein
VAAEMPDGLIDACRIVVAVLAPLSVAPGEVAVRGVEWVWLRAKLTPACATWETTRGGRRGARQQARRLVDVARAEDSASLWRLGCAVSRRWSGATSVATS